MTLIRGGGHHQGQNALILFQGPAAELVQVITNPATPHKFMNSEDASTPFMFLTPAPFYSMPS